MYVVFFPPCDARFCHIYLFSSLAARVFNKLTRLASCAHLVARPNKHTMPTQGGKNTTYIQIRETAAVRDATGSPGHGSPGHRLSDFGWVGSGHGSVCQTRCLTRFLSFNIRVYRGVFSTE